jgi:hypothetical protein
MTTTNAAEMSVCSLRTPWQSEPYTILLKCWQGAQKKITHYLQVTLCTANNKAEMTSRTQHN